MSGAFNATAPTGRKQKLNGHAESIETELKAESIETELKDVGNGQDMADATLVPQD
jgi:hypothetical protein